jgi:hypothetical protein
MAFWRRSKGRHALGAAVTSIPAGPPPAAAVPEPTPRPPGPRVELTFRDGSSASLDATQARALDEIAQVLTRRDEVKH